MIARLSNKGKKTHKQIIILKSKKAEVGNNKR